MENFDFSVEDRCGNLIILAQRAGTKLEMRAFFVLRAGQTEDLFYEDRSPSYVPPPSALPRDGRVEFERAVGAAMLRGAVCGRSALRGVFSEDGAG